MAAKVHGGRFLGRVILLILGIDLTPDGIYTSAINLVSFKHQDPVESNNNFSSLLLRSKLKNSRSFNIPNRGSPVKKDNILEEVNIN